MLWTRERVERGVLPYGTVVYAIGDVHGRADLLKTLVQAIRDDAVDSLVHRAVAVFMGDYVDRGPESRRVLDILSGDVLPGFEVRCLKGNHDVEMLGFLEDPDRGPGWVRHGGGETLASYGVKLPASLAPCMEWMDTRAAFDRALPAGHRRFLESLELLAVYGGYIFVHAGLMPGVSLNEQSEDDLLTIREPFLNDRKKFPWIVVHGHTPSRAPIHDTRRIGVDTGAFHTGVLTAVRLEGSAVDFIQVRN